MLGKGKNLFPFWYKKSVEVCLIGDFFSKAHDNGHDDSQWLLHSSSTCIHKCIFDYWSNLYMYSSNVHLIGWKYICTNTINVISNVLKPRNHIWKLKICTLKESIINFTNTYQKCLSQTFSCINQQNFSHCDFTDLHCCNIWPIICKIKACLFFGNNTGMFCYVSLISVTNFIVFACFIYNVRTETLSYFTMKDRECLNT